MNPEIKSEWLEKLRSGLIPQLAGYLGNVDGARCCLGVLCDIAVDYEVIPEPLAIKIGENSDPRYLVYGNTLLERKLRQGETSALPKVVQDWAGINSSMGKFTNTDGVEKWLSGLNDSGYSFEKIANIIEEYF